MGPAILAQGGPISRKMKFVFGVVALLLCWGHVSIPSDRDGNANASRGSPTLQPARCGLAGLHRAGRRSHGRSEAAWIPSSIGGRCCSQPSTSTRWDAIDRRASKPCGVGFSLTRRILHTQAGGDWEAWKDVSPFADVNQTPPQPVQTTRPAGDRKLKMTKILDQGDDGDFTVEGEDKKALWFSNYLRAMGGWPAEEEEPSIEQLSGLSRRLTTQDIAPFCDFAIFMPYGQKVARAVKYRTYVLSAGGYTVKELPGPSSYIQWRAAYRVLKSALIMLDAVGLANLQGYEMQIERLSRLYPACWHLIYEADELARSSHSNRLRSEMHMDFRFGKTPPASWDERRPWDWVFGAVAQDTEFWHVQVHGPALAWQVAQEGIFAPPRRWWLRSTCRVD